MGLSGPGWAIICVLVNVLASTPLFNYYDLYRMINYIMCSVLCAIPVINSLFIALNRLFYKLFDNYSLFTYR